MRQPITTAQEWRVRGVGTGWGNHVDVLTGNPLLAPGHDVSGFVVSREAGEKVVRLFKGRAYLDYRPSEPNWIQVKIATEPTEAGAARLQRFMDAVQAHENQLTKGLIHRYLGFQ